VLISVGVEVYVAVRLGVPVDVAVRVGVIDNVPVTVRVGVPVRVLVAVVVGVRVGVDVLVIVRVRLAVWEVVTEGLGDGENEGVTLGLGVSGEIAGPGVISPICTCRVPSTSPGLTGVISACEQNFPVSVQARASSSGESATGTDGGLMAELPLGPPKSMLVLSPARTS